MNIALKGQAARRNQQRGISVMHMSFAIVIVSAMLGVAIAAFIIWKLGSVSAIFGVPFLIYFVLKGMFALPGEGRR
jgi:ABC-type Fe3+-siderophore transport system permease subunit